MQISILLQDFQKPEWIFLKVNDYLLKIMGLGEWLNVFISHDSIVAATPAEALTDEDPNNYKSLLFPKR